MIAAAGLRGGGGLGGSPPQASAAGGFGGSPLQASAAGGFGGSPLQASAAGGFGGSSPQASAAGGHGMSGGEGRRASERGENGPMAGPARPRGSASSRLSAGCTGDCAGGVYRLSRASLACDVIKAMAQVPRFGPCAGCAGQRAPRSRGTGRGVPADRRQLTIPSA